LKRRALAAADQAATYISRIPFWLACPFLPTMMWSCTEMPGGVAISTIALVLWMSACDRRRVAGGMIVHETT